jgi:hypothetical protein
MSREPSPGSVQATQGPPDTAQFVCIVVDSGTVSVTVVLLPNTVLVTVVLLPKVTKIVAEIITAATMMATAITVYIRGDWLFMVV